jgi:hypothetical protein
MQMKKSRKKSGLKYKRKSPRSYKKSSRFGMPTTSVEDIPLAPEDNTKKEILMLKRLLDREKKKFLDSIKSLKQEAVLKAQHIYNKNIKMFLNNDGLTSAVLTLFLEDMNYFYEYKEVLNPRFFIKVFSCKEIFSYPVLDKEISRFLQKKAGKDVTGIISDYVVKDYREEINPYVFKITRGYVYETVDGILMENNPEEDQELRSIYLNQSEHAIKYWKSSDKLGLLLKNGSDKAFLYYMDNYIPVRPNDIHYAYKIADEKLPTKSANLECDMLNYLIANKDDLGIYLNNDCLLAYFIRLIVKEPTYLEEYKDRLPRDFFQKMFKYKEIFISSVGKTEEEDEYIGEEWGEMNRIFDRAGYEAGFETIDLSIYLNPNEYAKVYWETDGESDTFMEEPYLPYKFLLQNGSSTAHKHLLSMDQDVLNDLNNLLRDSITNQ